MDETIVENQICNACGADVRDGALFCYNCGGSVASEIVVEETDEKDKVSDVWLREKINENGNKQVELKESLTVEQIADEPIPKPDIQAEADLNSAAMRRKSTTFQKKTVEVVWQEHENAPNGLFIAAAIILTLFAAGILFLAMYLK